MSVGIGIIGRNVTMTVGGQTLLGVNSKGITLNNENLETTDDSSSGWTEFMAVPGLKNAELTISGQVKNLELVKSYFASSQIFEIVKTYEDGSTMTFDAVLASISATGESNGLVTFDASFASSGEVVFVAGT